MTQLNNPLGGIGEGFGSTTAERDRARNTVCQYATGRDEATELLQMLGLIDTDEVPSGRCTCCGKPLPLTARTNRRAYNGLCVECRRVAGVK